MGLIRVTSYPVQCDLEHNDIVQDIIEDEYFGDQAVYEISIVHWQELAGLSWKIYVEHPSTGKYVEQTLEPYDDGTYYIPAVARFPSIPLLIRCSLVRA